MVVQNVTVSKIFVTLVEYCHGDVFSLVIACCRFDIWRLVLSLLSDERVVPTA